MAAPPEDDIAAAGRFASNVSHEVNNPLTVIMMGVSFLLEDTPESNPQRKDMLTIKAEAERIRALLRLLSDYAHTELGDRRLVNLNNAVGSALDEVSPRILRQGIRCIRRFSSRPVIVSADPIRLGQALGHVVDNALDAMPSGGALLARTGQRGGQTVAVIEDSGRGISPDHLPLIFEPMFSASNTTGMGLAFARRIVKLHGGTLAVESAPGAGSAFTLGFPSAVPRR